MTVTNPGNGATTSTPVNITVNVAPPPPITVTVSPSSANVVLSASAAIHRDRHGHEQHGGDLVGDGGLDHAPGVYTAPAAMPASRGGDDYGDQRGGHDQVRARRRCCCSRYAQRGRAATGNSADLHAGRFLEQAAFGPVAGRPDVHPAEHHGLTGRHRRVAGQSVRHAGERHRASRHRLRNVQSDTLHRMATAPDQLRQKMAWALGQFIVISMNKNIYPDEYVPYQQILSQRRVRQLPHAAVRHHREPADGQVSGPGQQQQGRRGQRRQ